MAEWSETVESEKADESGWARMLRVHEERAEVACEKTRWRGARGRRRAGEAHVAEDVLRSARRGRGWRLERRTYGRVLGGVCEEVHVLERRTRRVGA